MMWERAAERVEEQGGSVRLGQRVVALEAPSDRSARWTVAAEDPDGNRTSYEADDVISSMPMRSLMRALGGAPEPVTKAAESLRYRDFLIVALIVRGPDRFPDNWVYIHDPSVTVGRVQNFKSWSPEMVPDLDTNCYGLEYFCNRGDDVWDQDDDALIEMAKSDLVELGMADADEIEDGHVVRQPKAYPVYDATYATNVAAVRDYLEDTYESMHLIGRNGMHKYNNQDHAIMTAMLTVDNILAGARIYDPWHVNEDAEYHESGTAGGDGASGLRMVPKRIESATAGVEG
jgi:protoporphyrinogen oxidase